MTEGVKLIAAERRRQIEELGFGVGRDNKYKRGQLAGAGTCYAEVAARQIGRPLRVQTAQAGWKPLNQMWLWSLEWWKPSADPLPNLVKAGALIAAEIDRLLREREDGDG
jgi:hypothetical protein